jgi:hypothetical protein
MTPYYKQFLQPMNAFLDQTKNLGDEIDYGQRKNNDVGEEVRVTLEIMERYGAPNAFRMIKFAIPPCEFLPLLFTGDWSSSCSSLPRSILQRRDPKIGEKRFLLHPPSPLLFCSYCSIAFPTNHLDPSAGPSFSSSPLLLINNQPLSLLPAAVRLVTLQVRCIGLTMVLQVLAVLCLSLLMR